MNTIRMIAIALPMMLLLACGGGGGGSSNTAATRTPTATPPTTGDPNTPPPTTGDPTTPPTAGDPMTRPTPTVMPEPLPDWRITNLSMARARVGGASPASMTETQIMTTIQTRATAADTLRIGDTVLLGFPGVGTDIKSSCSGRSCTVNVPGIDTLTFSLNDIEDLSLIDDMANLVGFNSQTRLVMLDNGITTAESRAAARQEDGTKLTFRSYGGWLTNTVFGTGYLNVTESGTTINRFTSFSFGKASGSNPTGTGKAVWTGSAVGIDIASSKTDLWQGDVEVDIDDLSNPNVDVSITNGANFSADDASLSFNWSDMTLTNGIFQHSSGDVNVWGSFYGDNHGEVGGTFDTDSFVGAFGATR